MPRRETLREIEKHLRFGSFAAGGCHAGWLQAAIWGDGGRFMVRAAYRGA